MDQGRRRYGCWGLTDDISNPNRNGKYAAIKSIVGGPSAAKPAAAARPPSRLTVWNSRPGRTVIRFCIGDGGKASLDLMASSGKLVKVLYNSASAAGDAEITLDTRSFAPGLYLLRLKAGNMEKGRRLIITR